MSLNGKVIVYKTRTINALIYEDELSKMWLWKYATVINTNPNSICIPINVCSEAYNKYKLCAYIDSGCSVCFRKRSLFLEFMWKKSQKSFASKDNW